MHGNTSIYINHRKIIKHIIMIIIIIQKYQHQTTGKIKIIVLGIHFNTKIPQFSNCRDALFSVITVYRYFQNSKTPIINQNP